MFGNINQALHQQIVTEHMQCLTKMIHKISVLLFTFVVLLAIFQTTDAASRIPQPTTDSTLVLKIFLCLYNYNIINKTFNGYCMETASKITRKSDGYMQQH